MLAQWLQAQNIVGKEKQGEERWALGSVWETGCSPNALVAQTVCFCNKKKIRECAGLGCVNKIRMEGPITSVCFGNNKEGVYGS